VEQADGQDDPTNDSPINFTATFDEDVEGFNSDDVSITGTAGATIVAITGDGPEYDLALSGMASDGTVIVSIPADRVTDDAGNGNEASTSTDNEVTYDNTDPDSEIDHPADDGSYNETSWNAGCTTLDDGDFCGTSEDATTDVTLVEVSVQRDDDAMYWNGVDAWDEEDEFLMEAVGTDEWTLDFDFANFEDEEGDYIVRAHATDQVGNTEATAENTFAIDLTDPTVTVEEGATQNDPTNASPINFTATFDEEVTGFGNADVTLGGTANPDTTLVTGGPAVYNIAVSGMANDGTVTASVDNEAAEDAAGNLSQASTSTDNEVTYDTTAPSSGIDESPPEFSDSDSATFEFQAEDGATIECKLDDGDWEECESPKIYNNLDEGEHTFLLRATDAAGNVQDPHITYGWTVDTVDPDTDISHPAHDGSYNETSWNAGCLTPADGDMCGVSDGTGSGVTQVDISLQKGAGDYYDPNTDAFDSEDEVLMDGGTIAAWLFPFDFEDFEGEGAYTVRAHATDQAGNTEATAENIFTVDLTAPNTAITGHSAGNGALSFSFTSPDPDTTGFECSLDPGAAAFAPCTSPKSYAGLANGDYTFQVRAKDAAGNLDEAPAEREVALEQDKTTVSEQVGDGDTVETGGGDSEGDPMGASVTTPNGGEVNITKAPSAANQAGYTFLGNTITIDAPDGSAADPLTLVFRLDASILDGHTADTVVVFRDDILVRECGVGEPPLIDPETCVSDRQMDEGDAVITVLTSEASEWDFAGLDGSPNALIKLGSGTYIGLAPDSFTVQGNSGTTRFTVKYLAGGVNVTPQVVAGTWETNELDPNGTETQHLQVRIKPKSSAKIGSTLSRLITVTSVGNPAEKDAVKARVTVKR